MNKYAVLHLAGRLANWGGNKWKLLVELHTGTLESKLNEVHDFSHVLPWRAGTEEKLLVG